MPNPQNLGAAAAPTQRAVNAPHALGAKPWVGRGAFYINELLSPAIAPDSHQPPRGEADSVGAEGSVALSAIAAAVIATLSSIMARYAVKLAPTARHSDNSNAVWQQRVSENIYAKCGNAKRENEMTKKDIPVLFSVHKYDGNGLGILLATKCGNKRM